MSLADFKATADYQTKIRDYARKFASDTDMTTVGQEFVWIKTDSNNWLTSLNYLFVAPKGASATASAKSHNLNLRRNTALHVNLKDVAAGTASAGMSSSSNALMNFELSEQSVAARRTLAAAVVAAYKAHHTAGAYDPTYTEYLTRLCTVTYYKNSDTDAIETVRLVVIDILEKGYIYYRINMPATAEKSDADLTTQLNGGEATAYTATAYEDLGELIYKPAN